VTPDEWLEDLNRASFDVNTPDGTEELKFVAKLRFF